MITPGVPPQVASAPITLRAFRFPHYAAVFCQAAGCRLARSEHVETRGPRRDQLTESCTKPGLHGDTAGAPASFSCCLNARSSAHIMMTTQMPNVARPR